MSVTKSSVLKRVAQMRAATDTHSWSRWRDASRYQRMCNWVFVTAAHNLLTNEGELRTELAHVELELDGQTFSRFMIGSALGPVVATSRSKTGW